MDTPPEWSTAVVSHTRPPATTGDDQPRPGTGVRHATFRPSPHSNGRFFSLECPCPPGPRNCGQSSARAPALHAANIRPNKGRNRALFIIEAGRIPERVSDSSRRGGGRGVERKVARRNEGRRKKCAVVDRSGANEGRKSISPGRSVTGFQGQRGANEPRVKVPVEAGFTKCGQKWCARQDSNLRPLAPANAHLRR